MGAMDIRRIYAVVNASKEGAARSLAVLKGWAGAKGIEVLSVETPPRAPKEEGSLVVALGGDGTVLRAAALFAETSIPILGANLGSLGFLTQVQATALSQALEAVLRDEFTLEERARLAFETSTGLRGTALNDLVVAHPTAIGFCEVELLCADGSVATYPGDGVVLCTPTGSTAYNLSLGGPIVVPSAECVVVTPLAAHRLGLRSAVFPWGQSLRVRTKTEAGLYADGDLRGDLAAGVEVSVDRAAQPTRLVRLRDSPPLFDVLRRKLNWPDGHPRKTST